MKMEILKRLLIAAMVILIGMSTLAMISLHWGLSQKTFEFSPKGIDNYLSTLGTYKALFTSTITTIAAYFGLHRLNAAIEANVQKVKQDRFNEWRSVLDVGLVRVERTDPHMKNEFIRLRYRFFEKLYLLNFNIAKKSQLENIFKEVFKGVSLSFEQQNKRNISMGGIYRNQKDSYSFDNFRYLFIIGVDPMYNELVSDLQDMYLECLPDSRLIDPQAYADADRDYRSRTND